MRVRGLGGRFIHELFGLHDGDYAPAFAPIEFGINPFAAQCRGKASYLLS
jgi:hypothetical protein